MKNERQVQLLAQRLFRRKQARRRALAELPFPQKIKLLVQLQRTAAEIGSVVGRNPRRPWKLA